MTKKKIAVKQQRKLKDVIYGNRIKAIMMEIEMSAQELSDLSNVSPPHLSRIINGQRRCISLPIAMRIALALKRPVEEVFIYRRPAAATGEDGN